jgi:Carboxypeptidase regulatory-like domain
MSTMSFAKKDSCKKSLGRHVRRHGFGANRLVWLMLSVLGWALPALARPQQPPNIPQHESIPPDTHVADTPPSQQSSDQQFSGSIIGTVVDRTGAAVVGARVKLTREGPSQPQESQSGDDGQFTFTNISPGPFQLTITAAGFSAQKFTGTLHPGEICVVPQIALAVAANVTQVQVTLSTVELAEVQIKEEEKQRVLGFIPNFYVSYVPDAAPLNPKQKFELAWKTSIDPVTFGLVGASAGIEQAVDQYNGFGQGAQGYGARYGTAFADSFISTFIGAAVLPSLLKQDPRYFYKGTGSTKSRLLYAIANAVICKGDNGRWQPNYSNVLGSFAAGGISNLYYPPKDRSGVALTFENGLIGIGASAAANIIQEFIVRKLTPNLPIHTSSNP